MLLAEINIEMSTKYVLFNNQIDTLTDPRQISLIHFVLCYRNVCRFMEALLNPKNDLLWIFKLYSMYNTSATMYLCSWPIYQTKRQG